MSGDTSGQQPLSGSRQNSTEYALPTWVSDPVAISAFSSLLARHQPSRIADRLAEVVRIAFHLDVAYVCLRDQTGVHEATHAAPAFDGNQSTWQHLLIQWARRPQNHPAGAPCYENGLRFIVRPIGAQAEWGFIGAACRRSDFPTPLNTMLLEFIAQFTGAVVREQHGTEMPAPVKMQEPALGCLTSLIMQAKRRRESDAVEPSHRLHTRLSMTPEQLKRSLKTLRLTQGQLARCISVSSATVKKWCQGRAKIPGPAVLIIKLMLEHASS